MSRNGVPIASALSISRLSGLAQAKQVLGIYSFSLSGFRGNAILLRATTMQKGFAVLIAFLLMMAWQYRKNTAALFFAVGTLFAAAAVLAADHVPDRILQSLALGWALCMLIAGVSGAARLAARLRKKAKHP